MLRQIILFFAGILCLGYYGSLCVYLKKWDATFSRFWLVSGIGFFLLGVLDRRRLVPPVFWWLFAIVVVAMAATFLVILLASLKSEDKTYDYLIVLGAQVRGTKITDSLRRRIERAQSYLQEHKETKVIVSGGQGKGEDITEAEAMAEYLTVHGIDRGRVILEKRSRTTMQNLEFSAEFLHRDSDLVGIVSNNFHLYRACQMAKKLGYQKAFPMAASCHQLLYVNYMVREVLAVWKEKI